MKSVHLPSGDMRQRVVIQSLSTEVDTYGGTPDPNTDANWTEFWRCWASIDSLSGRELQQADRLQSEITAEARIRYKADITTQMRLAHGTTIYDIRAVQDVGTVKREMLLTLRERT